MVGLISMTGRALTAQRYWGSLAMALSLCMTSACIDTGRKYVEIPLQVAGSPGGGAVTSVGNVPVELDEALVAFGPFYLCPGASAGDLCDTARVEWLGSTVVNALDPTPVRVGELRGVSGTVQSWMYDLGISSQLTQAEPQVLEAATQLYGASVRLQGRAQLDGTWVPFSVGVAVKQTEDTELGVPVVRKSVSERFFRDLGQVPEQLTVRFDARAWMQSVDLHSLVGKASCTQDSAPIICDGRTERRCQGGLETTSRDCAALGQFCQTEKGCVAQIEIPESSEIQRVLRNELLSGARPSMTWEAIP